MVRLLPIAKGMWKVGKSLEEIQTFLFQTVAVTTKWSSGDQAQVINVFMGEFLKLIQNTDVIPYESPAPSNEYVALTAETHQGSFRELTAEEYKAELEKRKAAVTPDGQTEPK
jgi:hypothetical protein